MSWLGIENAGWAEHSETQQNHIIGLHRIQHNLPK